MGNFTSKLFSHHNEHETKISQTQVARPCPLEKMKLCTPPITKRKLTTDPRSATLGIMRTPIEVASTPTGLNRRVASALPKYLQGKKYLETDFDDLPATPDKCVPDPRSPNVSQERTPIMVKQVGNYVSPIVTINQAPNEETPEGDRVILSTLDPRSPAIDFDRTPILKPRIPEHPQTRSTENINGTTDFTNIVSARLSYCETTTDYSIPEIQAISEIVNATSESLSLENRLNLWETSKNSISSPSSSTEDISDGSENEEQITVIRNPKILTSSSDAISTWTEDKMLNGTDGKIAEKCYNFDESLGETLDSNISEIINSVIKNTLGEQKSIITNDKIKVWRDSISPSINDETRSGNHKNNEEIIIEFDDETITKSTKNANATKSVYKVEDDKSKNQLKKRKPQQQQQQVNSENKSGTDERKNFDNEGKNMIELALNRTPLGNRSNNHKQRQLVTAKSPQLLRNKGLSARTLQQENTPPHTDKFISKTKSNGIQWDADTTVII